MKKLMLLLALLSMTAFTACAPLGDKDVEETTAIEEEDAVAPVPAAEETTDEATVEDTESAEVAE